MGNREAWCRLPVFELFLVGMLQFSGLLSLAALFMTAGLLRLRM